jgi:hypothetical protein
MTGCLEGIIKLRHLVAGSLGLSKQETLLHSKEALWRLGQAIESGQDSIWRNLALDDDFHWRGLQVGHPNCMTFLRSSHLDLGIVPELFLRRRGGH